jgi:hypothetical protein
VTFLKHLPGLLLIGFLATACSSTTMSGSWGNPDYTGKVENVYLIGIAKSELNRRIFEDTFSRHLSDQGVQAIPSYLDLPKSQKANRAAIVKAMVARGCDSVMLTKLIGLREETILSPGYASGYSSGPSYGGRGGYGGRSGYNNWGNYYSRSYDVVYSPPTTTTFVILTIESVLYDLKTEEMIWSAQLETAAEGDLTKRVQGYVDVVTKDLKQKGLI